VPYNGVEDLTEEEWRYNQDYFSCEKRNNKRNNWE